MSNHLPEKLTLEPWVRWPPWGSDMASTVSPGTVNAAYAAMLALAPEWGWTFACSAANRSLARAMPSSSALSTSAQPP